MRCAVLLLFLSTAAVAEDRFATDFQSFQSVKGLLTTPGGKARIYPAVEKLVEGGDARAVEHLARYLIESFEAEDAMRLALKKVQQRGADAREDMLVLDKEIAYMQRKLDAGDRSMAPEIQKRIDSRKQAERVFDEVFAKSVSLGRLIDFQRELRAKVATGLAKIVAGLEGDQLAGALAQLRAILDVARRDQALFLVEILRESGRDAAAVHLIDIVDHPKSEAAVRVKAIVALGRIRTPRAYAALLKVAERDEGLRAQILHALGMAAGQPFGDVAEAKAWVAKQG